MNRKKRNRANISRKIDIRIKGREIAHIRRAPPTKNSFARNESKIFLFLSFSRYRDFSAAPHYWLTSKRAGSPVPCLFSLIPIFLKSQPGKRVAPALDAPFANGIQRSPLYRRRASAALLCDVRLISL